jgi:hypothetical protein
LDERELLSRIKDEETASLGYHTGELSTDREEALRYYLQFPLGNEVEGESAVVDSSVRDTVEWMLPSLIRVFAASGRIAEFEPVGQEDVDAADQASDAVNHIFWKQNNGFLILYEWFKDALIEKNGIVKFYYEDKQSKKKETYEGLTDEQLAMLVKDDAVEVIAHTEYQNEELMQQMAPQVAQMAQSGQPPPPVPMLHDVEIEVTRDKGTIRVEAMPPEEFLISPRHNSVTMQGCPFCEHRSRKTISQLTEMGFDPKLLEDIGSDDDEFAEISGEYLVRRTYTEEQFPEDERRGPSRPVWLREVYIEEDFNDDGIAEIRKVFVAGNKILSNEETDLIPFAAITPNIMPHRFIGISVADEVMDIQLLKSTLWREILNNLYLSNRPRKAVLASAGGMVQANLDDLLNTRVGGVVREYVPGAVRDLETKFVAGAAYPMLEYIDQQRINRTGVNQLGPGLDADSINKTARGAQLAENKSAEKVELVARIFAETGVKDLMKGILKLANKHVMRPMMMRMHGHFVPVDPRNWDTEWDLTVNVGLGTGNKDQQLGHIMNIGQMQEKLLMAGKAHMVTDKNLFGTSKKIIENSGYKHVEEFITDPTTSEPPQPPPDPEEMKQQGETQRVQMKLEGDAQKTSANADQAMAEKEVEAQTQIQVASINGQTQIALQQMRQEHEMRMKDKDLRAEAEFKVFEANNSADQKSAELADKGEERVKKYDEPREKAEMDKEKDSATNDAIESVKSASEEAAKQLTKAIDDIQSGTSKQIEAISKDVKKVAEIAKQKPKRVSIEVPSGKTFVAKVE